MARKLIERFVPRKLIERFWQAVGTQYRSHKTVYVKDANGKKTPVGCKHKHKSFEAAGKCADKMYRDWKRAGKRVYFHFGPAEIVLVRRGYEHLIDQLD